MANILIVDNASFMRSSLKAICEQAGHKVVGMAADGREAVRLYKELKPDLVTMDILMEEMDGIQSLEEIRRYDPNARVVMVSAIGLEAKQEEARMLGAAGYIRKPFKAAEITSEIEKVLEMAG
ncbi:MAG: response regulator [Deltaproteobacteria bacterium]|nr:response regulator [Deltaproteobacteria bacterium]